MTLRQKTLAIVGGTLAVTILVLYFVARAVVVGGFSRVEKDLVSGFSRIETDDAAQNVQQVRDALKLRIQTLEARFGDWAQWDDLYRFVADRNAAFMKSNLTAEGLAPLKINAFLLLDTDGKPVFATGFDVNENRRVPVPPGLAPHVRRGAPLLDLPTLGSVVSGLLRIPEGTLMVVSRPIVRTDGSGPIRGILVAGRFLDTDEFHQLSEVTHLSLRHHDVDDPALPADFRDFKETLGRGAPLVVRPLSKEIVAGYTVYRDLFGAPALLLRVDVPRDIYRQGLATQTAIRQRGRVVLVSLVVSILVTGVVLGGAIHLGLESSVLARLAALTRRAEKIGADEDFSGRVEARGTDEIARLAGSVNRMLDALASTHGAVERRNAEMGLLMATVPTGLLSLDEALRVNPEYSRSAASMLGGGELRGRDYAEVLGLTPKDAGDLREFLGFVRDDRLPEESLEPLNPCREVRVGGAEEHRLRLGYRAILRGRGLPNHVLALLEDVTEARSLAEQVAKSASENAQLKAMMEDPDLFREMLAETDRNLREARALAARLNGSGGGNSATAELFRLVHTVKGVAGSFGLGPVSGAASELEDRLEELKGGESVPTGAADEVRADLERVIQVFTEALEAARRLLGDDGGAAAAVHLRLSSLDLARCIEEVRGLPSDGPAQALKDEVVSRLRALRHVPAHRGLARAVKGVPGLIERLGKDVAFRFEGRDTPVDCDLAHELSTPLLHVLRNALDHGIEDPEERLAAGKQPQGTVSVEVTRERGRLTVSVSDDGRGLDPELLREAAVARGLLRPHEARALSRDEALNLIFRRGFSTARHVTEVSGRGVGMDAVQASVRGRLGGDVSIESVPGRGTRLSIVVPEGPAPSA